MAESLIRKGADGFELNFGPLVVAEFNGIQFAIEDWRAKEQGFKIIEVEEIPAFFDDLKIVMQYAVAQIYIYPFNKADIKPLGKALSAHAGSKRAPNRVDVVYLSRILMMWENGNAVGEQHSIDHFYSEMSEEEIERSRF